MLSLKRWPHFRASAPSESRSRCSAGLISALPLVPNRAPAAALASFPRFRSFRTVLPLQRWPHFCASARSESCSRCSAGLISRAMPLRLPLPVLLLPFLPLQFLLLLLFVLVLLLFLLLIFLLILL